MSDIFNQIAVLPPAEAAKALLGCILVRTRGSKKLIGRIVETEAYHQEDAASHSYKWKTPRTAVMFGPAGFSYVYFTYGMHYCLNIVSGPENRGEAILIRALEPLEGIEDMQRNRKQTNITNLTNGPAKLCQAFVIDRTLSGHDLHKPPLQLLPPSENRQSLEIVTTERIGISLAKHDPLRFYIKNNAFVSKYKRHKR